MILTNTEPASIVPPTCGWTNPVTLWYNPIIAPFQGTQPDGVFAWYPCESETDDVSSSFTGAWNSSNTSIITVNTYGTHSGMLPGSTTSNSHGCLPSNDPHRNCPNLCYTPTGGANTARLSCSPGSLTRGSSTTCTVTNAPGGAVFSSWKFQDSNNNTVTSSQTTSSWSGTMVIGGTISVQVSTSSGNSVTLSASVTVTARSGFGFTAVSATPESNNSTPSAACGKMSIPSPPIPNSALGESCLDQEFSINDQTIGDSGPNQGYHYITSISNTASGVPTGYYYVISPDLSNTSSAFYQAQTGTYNAQTNPNGYISGANLLADTTRHESGTVNSHYENYVVAQNNSSNNLGDLAEFQVGPPSQSSTTFESTVKSTLTNAGNTIQSAFNVQPCNAAYAGYDATCTFQGYVNYNF